MSKDNNGKLHLVRVPLNSGGYEYGKWGKYYGVGAPLYRATDTETGEVVHEGRYGSREAAKAFILVRFPHARFFR